METKDQIYSVLKDIAHQTDSVFSGLYKGEESLVVFSSLGDKEVIVKELVGLLIRKAILSANELIKDFFPEFLFAEGKDFAIYIHILKDNIAIATIVDKKPNFSLLKFTHEKFSKNLLPVIDSIEKLAEEPTSKSPTVEPEKVEEESISEIEPSIEELEKVLISDKEEVKQLEEGTAEEEKNKPGLESSIEELEKALTPDIEENKKDKTVSQMKEEKENETLESMMDETAPVLEDILNEKEEVVGEIIDEETIENIEEKLDNIKIAFIKEIGPFGKILFNKILKELNIENKATKNNLNKLINMLTEEIPSEGRKEKFLKDIKSIIGG